MAGGISQNASHTASCRVGPDGQRRPDRQDLNTESDCHRECRITCDPLRLGGAKQEYSFGCRHPAVNEGRLEDLQDYQTTSRMHAEQPQHQERVDRAKKERVEEDMHLRRDGEPQIDSSASEIKRQVPDFERDCHLETTRLHLDQSRNAGNLNENGYRSRDRWQPVCNSQRHHDYISARYQSLPSRNLSHASAQSKPRCYPQTADLPRFVFASLLVNTILNHLTPIIYQAPTSQSNPLQIFPFPRIVRAEIIYECSTDDDCGHQDKICYENKCICKRPRPIEDKENSACLPHASLGEPCVLGEQCIGNSICAEGFCACPIDHISIFNPSTKLHYCHPKRALREECNYDSQCPENSFCSTKKYGCLCQNGYGASLVKDSNGNETYKCLPKACRLTSDCETEYHVCDENKCKCLASHFDPHTAGCYRFGSTGGLGDAPVLEGNTTILDDGNSSGGFKDLMSGDNLWLIVIILAVLTLIILAILIILLRKHYYGYCWTHTKEYEPNNENSSRNGQFKKNAINNKSFRRKSGDLDDEGEDGDDTAADRSNLVTTTGKKNGALLGDPVGGGGGGGRRNDSENHYVRVDMRGTNDDGSDNRRPNQQLKTRPLPSSTSTPV